jgi:tape measure domain-containing protein
VAVELNIGSVVLSALLNDTGFNAKLNALKANAISNMGQIAGAASTMAATAASSIVAIGVAAVAAFAVAAGAGIKMAADFEQTNIAFKTMLGSAEAAKSVLQDIRTFANTTPFEFPELANAGRSLLAFGTEAKDIVKVLGRIGDVASGVSAPIGELAELYGKMQVQGRLFAQDINQLTGRGIPIIGELAKQFGVTESEVKSLVEEGKVGFEQLEKAFISMTSEGGKFYNLTAEQSKSLKGLWSTLKDSVSDNLRVLGENIIKTFDLKGVLQKTIDFFNEYNPTIQAYLTDTLQRIKNTFIAIGEFVGRGLNLLRKAFDENFLGIRTIINFFAENVGKRVLAVVDFFKKVSSQADLMVLTLERIFRGLAKILEGVAYVVKGFLLDPFIKVGEDIGKTLGKVLGLANTWIDKLGALFGVDLKAVLGSAGSGIVDEFARVATDAFATLTATVGSYAAANDSVLKGMDLIGQGSRELAAAQADLQSAYDGANQKIIKGLDEITDSQEELVTESDEAETALEDLNLDIEDTGTKSTTSSEKVDKLTGSIAKLREEAALLRQIKIVYDSDLRPLDEPLNVRPDIGIRTDRNPIEYNPPEQVAEARISTENYRAALEIAGDTAQALAESQARLDQTIADSYFNQVAEQTKVIQALGELDQAIKDSIVGLSGSGAQAFIDALNTSQSYIADWQSSLEYASDVNLENALNESAARDAQAQAIYEDTIKAQQAADMRADAENQMALTLSSLEQEYDGNVQALIQSKRDLQEAADAIARLGLDQKPPPKPVDNKTEAEKAFEASLNSLKNQALGVAEQALPGLGNAISAFGAGPLAGIASIFLTLLSRSEVFADLVFTVSNFLQPIADSLGELLTALAPFIKFALDMVNFGLKPVLWILTNVIAPVLKAVANIIAVIWNAIASAVEIITFGIVKLPRLDPNGGLDQAPDPNDPDPEEEVRKERERQRDARDRALQNRQQGNQLDQRDLDLRKGLGQISLDDYVKELKELRRQELTLAYQETVNALFDQFAEGSITLTEYAEGVEIATREYETSVKELEQELQDLFIANASFDELISKAKELKQQLSGDPNNTELLDFLDEIKDKVKEILSITVSDFQGAVSDAIGDSSTYDEFLKNWADDFGSTTEGVLRKVFLESAFMKALFTNLGDIFTDSLTDLFISPEELALIEAAFGEIGKGVSVYYDLLEKLGIKVGGELEDANDELDKLSERLLNVPNGFKVALERFSNAAGINPTANTVNALQQQQFVVNGDVYGYDDFRAKVGQANTQLKTQGNLAKFGRRG